jgi:hypothetical protein
MVVLALVVLLLAAGGAYYFLKVARKPVPAAASLPASASPTARPAGPPPTVGYNSVTEQSYITQADNAFMAVQQPKIKAFNDAFEAFKEAGYVNARALTSKEAVTARRDLIAKCIAANDDYAAFVATQEQTYKDDLAKTPLTPDDAKTTLDQYIVKAKTPQVIQLRQAEHDYLKAGDDMMAALEKWYPNWSLNAAGKLSFKRKENVAEYNDLAQKCNTLAALVSKLQKDYNGAVNPDGSSSTGGGPTEDGETSNPAPTPAGAAPGAAGTVPSPSATPATTSPAPTHP